MYDVNRKSDIMGFAYNNYVNDIRFKIRNLNILLFIFFIFDLIISIKIIDGYKIIELNPLMVNFFHTQNYLPAILFKFLGLFLIIYSVEYSLEYILPKVSIKIMRYFYISYNIVIWIMFIIVFKGLYYFLLF